MQTISREKLLDKIETDADLTVIEVLGPEQFQNYHLPGAINIPIGPGFDRQVQEHLPDKAAPVVVYCLDADCDASPKAAKQLEELGYEEVYDYEAGKKDWKDAGLSVEQ